MDLSKVSMVSSYSSNSLRIYGIETKELGSETAFGDLMSFHEAEEKYVASSLVGSYTKMDCALLISIFEIVLSTNSQNKAASFLLISSRHFFLNF